MFKLFKEYLEQSLLSDEINIHDSDYKNTENYKKIKDQKILNSDGISISLESFIERYLLEKSEVLDNYESKYDMGNVYEFDKDECEYEEVAKEIITIQCLEDERDIDAKASEFVKKFTRKGGLIERLNTYLDFDLESISFKYNKDYKAEKCKILYFFYGLENVYWGKKINILKLFSRPSMENIDNFLIGMETYNGWIIRFIKNSLEKELSPSFLKKFSSLFINDTMNNGITQKWDKILCNEQEFIDLCYDIDLYYNMEHRYGLKEVAVSLMNDNKGVKKIGGRKFYTHSPIETLYLKIRQHEYIGNIVDIDFVNGIQKDYNYNIPWELIKEMRELHKHYVDLNNIEQYIEKNALKISKYVYLGAKVGKEDVRKIRKSKEKVRKLIDFCYRARPLLNIEEISNELQVISFLQAIILEQQNEIFDYIFYGYQNHNKHKPRVQAALKNDDYTCDALQVYWIRIVTDHFYMNIGEYDARVEMRELENAVNYVLKEILSKSDLCEMEYTSRFYENKLNQLLEPIKYQIEMIQFLIEYLEKKGFKYIDEHNKIYDAFDAVPFSYRNNLYNSLIYQINEIIKIKEPVLLITLEPANINNNKEKGFRLELFFDYQKHECILQRFEFL